jgi:hypothetical protein
MDQIVGLNAKDIHGDDESNKIFITAETYRDAGFVLFRRWKEAGLEVRTRMLMCAPIAMNQAFAIELYLKCLLHIETGKVSFKHDLEQLYNSLTKETQSKVNIHYEGYRAKNPESIFLEKNLPMFSFDLPSVLKMIKNAFIDFRYYYELKGKDGIYTLGNLMAASRRTIIEMKPEFEVLFSKGLAIINPHAAFIKAKDEPFAKGFA